MTPLWLNAGGSLDLDTDNVQFEARAQADSSIPSILRSGTFVYGPGRPPLASSRKAFRRSSFRSECRLASRAAFLPSILVFGRAPLFGGRSSKSSPVEVGANYARQDWGQDMILWDDFLKTLPLGHVSDTGSEAPAQGTLRTRICLCSTWPSTIWQASFLPFRKTSTCQNTSIHRHRHRQTGQTMHRQQRRTAPSRMCGSDRQAPCLPRTLIPSTTVLCRW